MMVSFYATSAIVWMAPQNVIEMRLNQLNNKIGIGITKKFRGLWSYNQA